MKFNRLLFLPLLIFISCSGSDDDGTVIIDDDNGIDLTTMYFPPLSGNEWETVSIDALGWNENAVQPLLDLLTEKNTKAFILLKNGRIVLENYFSETTSASNLPWFSAGKTLTAFTVGVAQQEGLLDINESTSTYLGKGWTSLTPEQEINIKVKNQLTMTTGLDYTGDLGCIEPACLQFLNPTGEMWYYHNAPYTLLTNVIEAVSPNGFTDYYNTKLRDRIGMNGTWIPIGNAVVFFSTPRSMARFGLLNLNQGIWDETPILNDISYFTQMTTSSQDLNEAYGYLWWLNGKETIRLPGSEMVFNLEMVPSAPDDLIAGLGLNDQKVYVVPSEGLVVIRMGEDAGEMPLGPSSFDDMLWEKIVALWE
jgi:CubicO group peptidase (beta-lactamase class C family)